MGKVPLVVNLLQVSVMLVLPVLVMGALLWLLVYSSVRLALRHEVAQLERRKARKARKGPADTGTSTDRTRPQLVRTRPAPAQGNGRPMGRPAGQPPPAARPVAGATRSRAAS